MIDITINHKQTRALIDTGSGHTLVNTDFAHRARLHIHNHSEELPPKLLGANGNELYIVGCTTAVICLSGYTHSVEMFSDLYHNVIIGMDALNDMNAVTDIANATFSVSNGLLTVPLIVRFFSARNIVRTLNCVTMPPLHETTIPVRISQSYMLTPSILEPLVTGQSCPGVLVAKGFVDPHTYTTTCQVVNIGKKPVTITARYAIATIAPAQLLSSNKSQHFAFTSETLSNPEVQNVNAIDADIPFVDKLDTLHKKALNVIPKISRLSSLNN